MPSTFTLHRTGAGQFYLHLKSHQGEILLTSESFVFKTSCLRTIEALRLASAQDYNYQQGLSMDRQHFFVIRGTDLEVLATSGFYLTPAQLTAAREIVQREASVAETREG